VKNNKIHIICRKNRGKTTDIDDSAQSGYGYGKGNGNGWVSGFGSEVESRKRQIVNLNEMLNQYKNAQKVSKRNEMESGK